MSNRKTFDNFGLKKLVQQTDFLVGFDVPESGGEKKFRLSDLKNFVKSVDVHTISSDTILPTKDQSQLNNQSSDELEIPFLAGKVFHITSDDHALIELPDLRNLNIPENSKAITCMVVNLTNNKRVELKTVNGMPSLNAKGVISYQSGLSDSTTVTFLKKKYDTALFYYANGEWYGYGDLEGATSLNIKNIYSNYTFTLEDEDKFIHVTDVEEGIGLKITLPHPSEIKSGTQFFVHNISDGWVEFMVPVGVNFHARAKFLRGRYDDAVVYTDGVSWFATGDLS